ncbi:MAG: hypothetical protein E7012_04805 [Alphaproteobacteria bacterium]|nr:hypothetical protein [Alphaproteobacteria bacterium]
MKKYLILTFVIVILGVFGTRIWLGSNATIYNTSTAIQELAKWVENPDETIIEIIDDELYIQEAIGSTGSTLKYPLELKGNFRLTFQLLSLTQKSSLKFILQKDNNKYEVEIGITPQTSSVKLSKNSLSLIEKNGIVIQPNKYYTVSLENNNNELSFYINETDILKMNISAQAFELKISMHGLPSSPAAFKIRDFEVCVF